jgi:cobalt/nickel transport system permease protein
MVFFIGVLIFVFQRKPLTQNLIAIWNIFIKTILVVICLAVLTQTTDFYRLIKALELLKLPKLFISLLGFTHRYLQLLLDETIKVKRAIDSRCLGKRGKIEGAMILKNALFHVFLRTFDRSERIYAAMLSRGYERTIPTMSLLFLKKRDFVFAGVFFTFIFFVWVAI